MVLNGSNGVDQLLHVVFFYIMDNIYNIDMISMISMISFLWNQVESIPKKCDHSEIVLNRESAWKMVSLSFLGIILT